MQFEYWGFRLRPSLLIAARDLSEIRLIWSYSGRTFFPHERTDVSRMLAVNGEPGRPQDLTCAWDTEVLRYGREILIETAKGASAAELSFLPSCPNGLILRKARP
jgi:hypothetical protein